MLINKNISEEKTDQWKNFNRNCSMLRTNVEFYTDIMKYNKQVMLAKTFKCCFILL